MFRIIFGLTALFLYSCPLQANECLGWFLRSGLTPKTNDCELKCSVTPVDLGNFSCPSQCSDLCSKSLADHVLAYVPRLTEGDKAIVAKMPYEAYKVFVAKEKVDKLTSQVFKNPGRKDESDAFRHFVWSVLLVQEIGTDKARMFLEAHEIDTTQSNQEKEMDLFNNDQGIKFSVENKKNGKSLELDEIEKEGLLRLRQKKLKVISPRLKEIPRGYYSK